MVTQLELSISQQADNLYKSLANDLGKYVEGLRQLGYELLKGGHKTELGDEWSIYCHPHYLPILHVLNLDLSVLTEDEFINTLSKYYDSQKDVLPDNILLPNPKSMNFQYWDAIDSLP
jgi:hypothetical protein